MKQRRRPTTRSEDKESAREGGTDSLYIPRVERGWVGAGNFFFVLLLPPHGKYFAFLMAHHHPHFHLPGQPLTVAHYAPSPVS